MVNRTLPPLDAVTAAGSFVFRNTTVVSVDPATGTLDDADVLVVGDAIAGVGPGLDVPEGTVEIDARGGIVMPGMIDTHRHMWQSVMRGYGADWTLTNYFYFYYLDWGQVFRPEEVYAGNLLAGLDSIDAGVTTTLDWSHGLRTTDHAEAAVDALERVDGRFVFAYGNLSEGPWEWSTRPEFKDFVSRRLDGRGDMLRWQIAFDVPGDPAFPEGPAFAVARELDARITTHSGVWGATSDASIQLIAEHGYLTDKLTHVHVSSLAEDSYQRIAASGAHASVATESECSAGQGYSPTARLRKYGIPISLSVDTSSWWSGDMFGAMRAALNLDRAREHLEAHRTGETVMNLSLRADEVVRYATLGGAEAVGLGDVVGSITVGKKADLVLVLNDNSPVMFPIVYPEGHLVFQAGRNDVHTVLVNGKPVKYAHQLLAGGRLEEARRLCGESIEHLRGALGEEAWHKGMHPDQPDEERIDNPYQYSEFEGTELEARDEG
jgi:cytosine/adenosine deaminase-related metal-dependent hydrolase